MKRCLMCSFKTHLGFAFDVHTKRRHLPMCNTEPFDATRELTDYFMCAVCPFGSQYKLSLRVHSKLDHGNSGVIAGPNLNHGFSHNLKSSKCLKCQTVTSSVLCYVQHFNNSSKCSLLVPRNNGRTLYHCLHCSFQSDRSALGRHMMYRHTSDEDVNWRRCEHCSFRAKSASRLRAHVLRRHTDGSVIKWFQCEQCSFRAKVRSCVMRHKLAKHTLDKDVQKWFQCRQCLLQLKTRGMLKDHVLSKHTPYEDVKWLQCEHCSYRSKWRGAFKRHIVYKHTANEDLELFLCQQCPYQSKTKADFKRHVTHRHSDIRDVHCGQCSYRAKTTTALKKHVSHRHAVIG